MKRVLITGGAGFIGLHLARHLLNVGYTVTILDNFFRAEHDSDLIEVCAHPHCSLHVIDLNTPNADLTALGNNYEAIFHLAAIIGVRYVLEDPYAVLSNNIRQLENVIAFCRKQHSPPRLVFASTSEIYDESLVCHDSPIPTPESTIITVPDINKRRTSYMLSKIYGEAMCADSWLPYTTVRFFNVYGPRMGMSHVIPELMQKVHKNNHTNTLEVYSPEHTRTFCYIDDATIMLQKIIETDACSNMTFNIGNPAQEISMKNLAAKILSTMRTSRSLSFMGTTPGSAKRRCPDIKELVKKIGYKPQINLDDGLTRTYQWYADKL